MQKSKPVDESQQNNKDYNNNFFLVHAKNVVVMNTMEFVFIVKLEMEHKSMFQFHTLPTILQVLQTILHNLNMYHTLVSYVGMILITVTISPTSIPFVYNQDPCFNQNFDYFPQTSPSFPQQYLCCENYGGPHETFQCQPMNEDYYHEQNSCYDSNSFGFDQVQPPQYTVNHPIFNSQNELLNSSNKLMEQMATLCDLVGQAIQKKEEEKRIAEEQAAKDRYWKIPICYDDDEDNTTAITPVLPLEEPYNSLSMGDKHLDTTTSKRIRPKKERLVLTNLSNPQLSPKYRRQMCDVPSL
ncbi:hypothetical protein Tco_0277129 [Tanacetum coccineum]